MDWKLLTPEKIPPAIALAFALVYLGQNGVNGRTREEMKNAYRKYLLKHHPDKNNTARGDFDSKVPKFFRDYERNAEETPKKIARGLFAVHWLREAVGTKGLKDLELNPKTKDLTALSFLPDKLKGRKRHDYSKCDMHVNFLMGGLETRHYKKPHRESIAREFEKWKASASKVKSIKKSTVKPMRAIEYFKPESRRKSLSKSKPPTKRSTSATKSQWTDINKKSPCSRKNSLRNPDTLKCRRIKACGNGMERSAISNRCKKVVACKKNTKRNHITMRCGKVRGVKKVARKKVTRRLKPCKTNQKRNPSTNRCRKVKQ